MLDETIVITFAELTRFQKNEDECVTEHDRLLYLLKNSGQMRTPPKWGSEGRREGHEDGRTEAKLEDAKKLKELGVSVDIISQATGLSIDVIESL